jgi:hypothetical protein
MGDYIIHHTQRFYSTPLSERKDEAATFMNGIITLLQKNPDLSYLERLELAYQLIGSELYPSDQRLFTYEEVFTNNYVDFYQNMLDYYKYENN